MCRDSYIPVLWFQNKGGDIQFETDEKHLQSSGIEAIIWLSIVSDEDAYPWLINGFFHLKWRFNICRRFVHTGAIAKWMKAMPFVTMMYSNQNIGVQFVTKPQGLPGKIDQEKRLLLFHSYLAWKSLTLAFKSRPCKPDWHLVKTWLIITHIKGLLLWWEIGKGLK